MDTEKNRKKLKDARKRPKRKSAKAGAARPRSAKERREEEALEKSAEIPGIALTDKTEEAQEELLDFLWFSLSGRDYAIPVTDIEEVLRGQKITFVPRVEEFISGVTSVRGSIVPVLDLRGRLSPGVEADYGKNPKTVLLRGPEGTVGVLVPGELDIISVPEKEAAESRVDLDGDDARFVAGCVAKGERLISIIRTEEVLKFRG